MSYFFHDFSQSWKSCSFNNSQLIVLLSTFHIMWSISERFCNCWSLVIMINTIPVRVTLSLSDKQIYKDRQYLHTLVHTEYKAYNCYTFKVVHFIAMHINVISSLICINSRDYLFPRSHLKHNIQQHEPKLNVSDNVLN